MPAPQLLHSVQSRPAPAPPFPRLSLFGRTANAVSHLAGKPATFILCCAIVIGWAVSGPLFHYSDTWQLVINTGTTIITFLMVFLIQNTQNREGAALQAKLDELIRATRQAHNTLVALERRPEEEVEEIREEIVKETLHFPGGQDAAS
jgi:low affinity Fe/Cu permease